MLEVLTKHLDAPKVGCSVAQWIKTLSKEEQAAFAKIRENSKSVNTTTLYQDLATQIELPFKLTAFRSHIRGYCTCQK